MKKLLLILLLVPTLVFSQGTRPPVDKISLMRDAVVTSPTNGQVFTWNTSLSKWINATPAAATTSLGFAAITGNLSDAIGLRPARGMGKEIWLAARTDSKAGAGTPEEPFDISTKSKLDTLWPQLFAGTATGLGGSPPSHVIVRPGVYLTDGNLYPIPNCLIEGWGATFKMDTTAAVYPKKWIFGSAILHNQIDNCTIQGFTFDNNFNNQAVTNSAVGAIFYYGSGGKVLYNKFIGWGTGSSDGQEDFVVGINTLESPLVTSLNVEIAYNEFTQVDVQRANGTGGNTLIGCSLIGTTAETFPTAKWSVGAKIHDNWIHDIPSLGTNSPLDGIGIGAWSVGQEIYNNTFYNIPQLQACIYADTGGSLFAHIFNNHIYNCNGGLFIVGAAYGRGITIEKNDMQITTGNPSSGFRIDSSGAFPDLKVLNNSIQRWGTSGTVQIGMRILNMTTAEIKRNFISSDVDNNYIGTYTGLTFQNNVLKSLTDLGSGTGLSRIENFRSDGTLLFVGEHGLPQFRSDLTNTSLLAAIPTASSATPLGQVYSFFDSTGVLRNYSLVNNTLGLRTDLQATDGVAPNDYNVSTNPVWWARLASQEVKGAPHALGSIDLPEHAGYYTKNDSHFNDDGLTLTGGYLGPTQEVDNIAAADVNAWVIRMSGGATADLTLPPISSMSSAGACIVGHSKILMHNGTDDWSIKNSVGTLLRVIHPGNNVLITARVDPSTLSGFNWEFDPINQIPMPFTEITTGTTISLVCDPYYTSQRHKVVLGSGSHLLAITRMTEGMTGILEVTQDATGTRTMTLPTGSKVSPNGAGAIPWTSAANATDIVTWYYDGTRFKFTYSLNAN